MKNRNQWLALIGLGFLAVLIINPWHVFAIVSVLSSLIWIVLMGVVALFLLNIVTKK
ncbi:MAG: hypothetical protein ACYDBJ_19780 [Aggregatilineales bacterium]